MSRQTEIRQALRSLVNGHGYITAAATVHDLIVAIEDAQRAMSRAAHTAVVDDPPQNPGKLQPVTVRHDRPRAVRRRRHPTKIPTDPPR
jgi:hypothetical protein